MFFAPPKVKSISRYAEYGAYLGHRHFLMMLGVAITAHLTLIAIYSMIPREEVIKIPVRVLNIKLSGGSIGNGIHMPVQPSPPVAAAVVDDTPVKPKPHVQSENPSAEKKDATEPAAQAKPAHEDNSAGTMLDKAMGQDDEKPAAAGANPRRVVHTAKGMLKQNKSAVAFATPKKYVRESEEAADKAAADKAAAAKNGADGNGSGIKGDAGGQEVIERYTQTISQWIKNHQLYARAAYGESAGGQESVKGQVVVRLRIDREGHILYNSIDHSSGNELVDQAAIAMVRASNPVPAVPHDYPSDSQLEFLIAVQVDFSKQ